MASLPSSGVGEGVEDTVLSGDERRQLGQHHVRHGGHVPLPLKHPREALEIRLQPVLLGVLSRGLEEVANHLVELVLQHGDLAAGLHADLPRQVSLGDRCRHIRDRTHLVGQVRRQLIDIIGQVLPDAGDFRRLRLATELPLHPDLARYAGHLTGEAV